MNSRELAEHLTKKLMGLTYESDGYRGGTYDYPVINSKHEDIILTTVQSVINDNFSQEVGELKAKVYTYEKIIANSNFSQMTTEHIDYKIEIENLKNEYETKISNLQYIIDESKGVFKKEANG